MPFAYRHIEEFPLRFPYFINNMRPNWLVQIELQLMPTGMCRLQNSNCTQKAAQRLGSLLRRIHRILLELSRREGKHIRKA